MDTLLASPAEHAAAVVWLDRTHALIARARDGHSVVTEVHRDYANPELQYLLRIAHEAAGSDRVVVMGPDASRIALEREYVALYHRPDRLIDVGFASTPGPRELVEQLRFIEPSLSIH